MLDVRFDDALVVDGTGAPARPGSVGVRDGRIQAVGDVDEPARRVVDCGGATLAPGFVDTPLTQKNDFPMPMRWPVQKAARHIATRLDRQPYEIAFPAPFIAILRLLGSLPRGLQLAIGKRLSRTESRP